jgi:transposase
MARAFVVRRPAATRPSLRRGVHSKSGDDANELPPVFLDTSGEVGRVRKEGCPSMPAPHPTEFRQRAVDLARTGDKPIAQLAKDLRISESCLRNWIARANADESPNSARPTSAEKKELVELRRQIRQLEMENEILKRAAAYFAKENVLPK